MTTPQPAGRWRIGFSRPALVDATFVLALGLVAIFAFQDTFHGWGFLLAGGLGLFLGVVLAHVAAELRQPVVVMVLFVVVTFFLLGGAVAGPSSATAALPLPDTLVDLADQSVNGWKELLTTLPPVDGGRLLALPYLLGLVGGAGALTVARRLRSAYLPVLASFALLVTVILLGVQHAGHLLLVGGLSAVLGVAWALVRARRLSATVTIGSRSMTRLVTAVALCGVAGALALALGPRLPGLGDERVVLRTWVEPPFDIGQYPTPLASFRKYTDDYKAPSEDKKLFDKELMKVEGLPQGTLVRFAGLDNYNGIVWGAANDSGLESGNRDTFQKVSSVIESQVEGREVTAKVTIDKGYQGVWLPAAGALTEIDFGSGLGDDTEEFRYNLATDTGVVPGGINPGDSYRFKAVLPDTELEKDADLWQGSLPGAGAADRFQQVATEWGGEGSTQLERVLAVAEHLKSEGKYTDGGPGEEQFPAGHSLSRLATFVAADQQMAGDDEQYAAMMALLANQLGVPARVVMGAAVPEDGVIKGQHVHAWVELRAADGGWRTLPTNRFMNPENEPDKETPKQKQLVAGKVIPPPAPVRPPATAGDPIQDSLNRMDQHRDGGFQIPGFVIGFFKYVVLPLALVAAVLFGIVWLKERRRRTRRTTGAAATRLAAAWRDLLDHARDHGHAVSGRATRREQARQLPIEGLAPLARGADAHVFGAGDPTDEQVKAYWEQVDQQRAAMNEPLNRWQRLKVAVNLASFRRLEGTGRTS